MIKEAMMKQAQKQLGEAAEKGFKVLQDKINRVNEQNDDLIEQNNQLLKSILFLATYLMEKNPADAKIFKKLEKKLDIKMELE